MPKLEIKQISASDTLPLRQSVMYPDYPLEYVILEKDSEGIHFGGFIEEELICVVSLFFINNEVQFRKLATLETYQKNGFGSQMIKHLIAFSKTHNATKFWCNARTNKTSYYHKFGLKETKKTFTKSGINFVIMELNF
ncbi:GNAT family N-acetyltransferase [Maribacter sp.]|uniref:GNAT family N-acetyltransferase n=1 Tax=Maribacter sp. TaxID=1897614 RepID=UPI0025BCC055|nr:GNAT family N-acetyltransferase [Maribacter sp.]